MRTKRDLVIGLDCSTTASKAIVWDLRGFPVAAARRSLELLMPRPAWHEQRAEDWWTATAGALREVTGQVDPRRLAALAISHQRETFVPVDAAGYPLRDAIVWMDERCGSLLPELRQRYGLDRPPSTGSELALSHVLSEAEGLSKGQALWLLEALEPEAVYVLW
jgi:xylulokinase